MVALRGNAQGFGLLRNPWAVSDERRCLGADDGRTKVPRISGTLSAQAIWAATPFLTHG